MNKFLKIAGFSMVFSLAASAAQADVFYWQDPESGASLTFPDRWLQVNNQNPGDVLTVRAPGADAFAECRLNVQPEGRFKIYPVGLSSQIQKLNFSRDYWDGYFGAYNNVTINDVRDNAGLGRGFASTASASYETAKGPRMLKRSVAYVSYFNKHVYTVECSAENSAFDKYFNPFLSVVKSVDFKKPSNYNYTGYYRDFLKDKPLKVRGQTMLDDTYH